MEVVYTFNSVGPDWTPHLPSPPLISPHCLSQLHHLLLSSSNKTSVEVITHSPPSSSPSSLTQTSSLMAHRSFSYLHLRSPSEPCACRHTSLYLCAKPVSPVFFTLLTVKAQLWCRPGKIVLLHLGYFFCCCTASLRQEWLEQDQNFFLSFISCL